MGYLPPNLSELITRVFELETHYRNTHPERRALILLLKLIHNKINDIWTNEPSISDEVLQKICLGFWFFSYEYLPPYRTGYIYNSGSTLQKIIGEGLNLNPTNLPDNEFKLICLASSYHFLFTDYYHYLSPNLCHFQNALKEENVNTHFLHLKLKNIMHQLISHLNANITTLLKATPTEEAMQFDLIHLPEHYKTNKFNAQNNASFFSLKKSTNKNRIFLVQLSSAIGQIAQIERGVSSEVEMPRSQCIKIAINLYILHIITNEYYMRSPLNSELCKLVLQNLNEEKISPYCKDTQIDCLLSLKYFLSDNGIIQKLEEYGTLHFGDENVLKNLDRKIHFMLKELDDMMAHLNVNTKIHWPITQLLGLIFGVLMAPHGYAAGSMIGFALSETNTIGKIKSIINHHLNYFESSHMQSSSAYNFNFLAVNFYVQSALTRAFAQSFEYVFILAGIALGGAMGLIVDFSFKGFQEICSKLLHLSKASDPMLIKNCNKELIITLMNLPEEFFDNVKKNHLKNIIKEGAPLFVSPLEVPKLKL